MYMYTFLIAKHMFVADHQIKIAYILLLPVKIKI